MGSVEGLIPVLIPVPVQLEFERLSTSSCRKQWFVFQRMVYAHHQRAGDCAWLHSEMCLKKTNDAANVNCSALLGHQDWASQTAEAQEVLGK